MSSKALMVVGTASDVGKSVLVTGLCRMFARAGVRVAPFKSQNMSNNSAVCAQGEIGRAQAVQAEACGLEPSADMNPVLLKPESERGCQVVIGGQARMRMAVGDYEPYRAAAWPAIVGAYRRLAERFELIVIEGAGGAAEVNLRQRDLANWRVAELADAAVVLVGDIDKGGVFAALYGTVELLMPEERRRLAGYLVNKFRGDPSLLQSGLEFLHRRTGIPVLGVMPYLRGLEVPREDSASLAPEPPAQTPAGAQTGLRAAVIHLPRIANYTDFQPLEREPGLNLRYLTDPGQAGVLDLLLIPGSKSTVADLQWMREAGWEDYLVRHRRQGGFIVGICGGYQMLGRHIEDPEGIESATARVPGLGLLEAVTRFGPGKVTARVAARHRESGSIVRGYQIHSGRVGAEAQAAPFELYLREGEPLQQAEGASADQGQILGTTIHGLFDEPEFRSHFLQKLRASRRVAVPWEQAFASPELLRLGAYDRLADEIEQRVDLKTLAARAGIPLLSRHVS